MQRNVDIFNDFDRQQLIVVNCGRLQSVTILGCGPLRSVAVDCGRLQLVAVGLDRLQWKALDRNAFIGTNEYYLLLLLLNVIVIFCVYTHKYKLSGHL